MFIDGQPLRTRLPSRQTLVHSPLCAPPSIDANTSILIIAHIRWTPSYFSRFLSFSRFSISAILPPLIPLSLPHRVSLFSCCRYPHPSLLYLSTNTPHTLANDPMSCLFSSIHLPSIIHYTDIVPPLVLSHALCLETPLFLGRLLPPSSIATLRAPHGCCPPNKRMQICFSSPELWPRLALFRRATFNLQRNNRTILLSSPTHTYHNPAPL